MSRKHIWLIVAGFVLIGGIAIGLWWYTCKPTAVVSSGEIRQDLAEERIEKIQTKAKTQRKAARARVDKEVQDATATSDLVDFINARSAER